MAENIEGPDKECLLALPNYMRRTGEFILDSAFKLNWGDLSKDCVMDIGCGVDSLQLFQTLFPKFYRVIAIDISREYINYLKFYQAYRGMEYCAADITNQSTLSEWKGTISKTISIFLFNCLKNQKLGFENILYLLKPGGEAIILTALRNPHYECAKYLFKTNKWKIYRHLEDLFTDHGAHAEGLTYYQRILKEVGFEIVVCEEEFKFLPFLSEEDFKASEYTQDKVIMQHITKDLHDEWKEDYFNSLILLNGRSPDGHLCLRTSTAKIIIRKKEE